jgi:apolipoprotein D and lipocalin family protein
MMQKILCLLGFSLLFTSCASIKNPPQTVSHVQLKRYMGRWYEIASLPNFFQRHCRCTTANYTLSGKEVKVLNQCYKGSQYQLSAAHAKAWPVAGSHNSKLKVRFFWPFTGDYWVLYLSKDYQQAIVGTPSRNYLWILARTKHISDKRFLQLVSIAKSKGYDLTELKRTQQDCPLAKLEKSHS